MKNFKYYDLIGMMFIAITLTSTIVAQKLVSFGPVVVTGAIIIFPLTYIFGDILTEVYGYAASRRIIWSGFLANILMATLFSVVVALPSAAIWSLQGDFQNVLGQVPRIVIAGLLGYCVGEFINSFILAKLKVATQGKYLWVRTIGSTVFGEAADTVIFVLVAFAGLVPTPVLLSIGFTGYLCKVAYEVTATPLTYIIVGFLKRKEGVDVYDRDTNFNPFFLKP